MRPLQWWLNTKDFSSMGSLIHIIKGYNQMPLSLDDVVGSFFYPKVPHFIAAKLDRCFTEWLGAILERCSTQSLWKRHHLGWHIHCLEMLVVFWGLKYFFPDLRGYHILFQLDNRALATYVNQQGGLRSHSLYRLALQILLCDPRESFSQSEQFISQGF